jgi:hypothetical protein
MDQWTKSPQSFCLPYPGGKYFYESPCFSFCQIFNWNFSKNFIVYFSLYISFPITTGTVTRIHKMKPSYVH